MTQPLLTSIRKAPKGKGYNEYMPLYFITGNEGKYKEVKKIIPDIEQLDVELPEAQELNAKVILEKKLQTAMEKREGAFIVEDTSFTLVGMKGLPGPLIKWFMKSIGNEGLYKLSGIFGCQAEAKVIIGYTKNKKDVLFFEGKIKGKIVAPKGEKGFGWDPIFLPNGHTKTFGEMEMEEKNRCSMRKIAAEKLKNYLDKEKKENT
jgi:non-canonical purine NTP pyrophosphatase (RdgB/HAM1 family)